MKRMEAGSGRNLADIETLVLRLFEIEEGFGRHPHAGKVDHGSAASPSKAVPIVAGTNADSVQKGSSHRIGAREAAA